MITNSPTPYRIPLFNRLREQLLGQGLRLKVVFAVLGYSRRKWAINMSDCNFEYIELSSSVLGSKDRQNLTFTYPGLYKLLGEEQPSAVITNEFSIATIKLWLYSIFRKLPYIIWSGAIAGEHHGISILRKIQRRLLIRRAAGYVAYGSCARDNLVTLGADSRRIHIAINTVDTDYFREASRCWNVAAGNEVPRFVFVGHLESGKRLDLLLNAARELKEKGDIFVIDIVGDGPDRKRLENLAGDLNLGETIEFKGFRQKDDIARYMGRAACFVFPSEYDVWGLVLVEAMACGLPCISSYKSGATRDLIVEGKTGFSVDFSDISSVVERMHQIVVDPDLAASMGAAAAEYIENNCTLEISAHGFTDALVKCISIENDA